MSTINEKTLVPVGIVATVFSVLIGGLLWLTDVQATGKANTSRITGIEEAQDKGFDNLSRKLDDINTRLSKMEGYLYKGKEGR